MSNIIPMPVWKEGATPAERLEEVVHMAREHPERYGKMVLLFNEQLPSGAIRTRYVTHNLNTLEAIGVLEIGKQIILGATNCTDEA